MTWPIIVPFKISSILRLRSIVASRSITGTLPTIVLFGISRILRLRCLCSVVASRIRVAVVAGASIRTA